jgi:hypothetical protein
MNVNNADVNLANDFAKLRDMKNELRRLEESISRRAERSPVTAADEARMLDDQARADSAYQAANRRAPPALPLEQPSAYRRRLADGVKAYSPRWQQADLASMPDDALAVVEQQIYADAVANGRTHGLSRMRFASGSRRAAAAIKSLNFMAARKRISPASSRVRHGSGCSGRTQNMSR